MSNELSTSSSSKSIMSALYGQDQHNLTGSASGHVRPELSEQQTLPYYQNNQNAAQGSEVASSSSVHGISYSSPIAQAVVSPLDPCLRVELQDLQLWESFSAAKTEMIVTKPGRRMFPGYRVKFSGMDQKAKYCVLMDIVSVDQHRYKFQNGGWAIAGRGEPQVPQRFYLHPTSPASGQDWMKEIVSFHKVKLTNSCGHSTVGKFLIHSMHRYQPRIHVVRSDDVSTLHLQPRSTFSFPQTMFITVTAYQNQEVTKLKVDNNPFARGFRTNGGKTRNAQSSSAQQEAAPVFNISHPRIVDCLPVYQGSKRWKNSPSLHEAKRQGQSTQQPSEETAERHQILRKDPRITSSAQPTNFEPQYQAFQAALPPPINGFNFPQSESSTATSMELNQPATCYNSRAESLSVDALETSNFSAPVASLGRWNLAVPSQYDSNQAPYKCSTYQSNGTSFVAPSNYGAAAAGPAIQTNFMQAKDDFTYPPFTAPEQVPRYNPSLPYNDDGYYSAPIQGNFGNAQDCAYDVGSFQKHYDETNDDCSDVSGNL
ncbi:uncharacterized protein LOC143463379 [Clavelina lepadiformis]|uniref:uncharacterized protein LOC143463379 n=1 Tax=Clavelina lepadiformis TaxID=159417 RepID=UPI00404253A9